MSEEAVRAVARALGIAPGYHDISGTWHEVPVEMLERLIAAMGQRARAPAETGRTAARCFLPKAMAAGERCWGLAVQLYGLTSARNWGIGDFGDLGRLLSAAAEAGAAAVQLNPLHALFPCFPDHVSPYAPSSRLFLNPLYIDVEAVDDFGDCAPARGKVSSPAFQQKLSALRAAPLVDYEGAAACKFEILEILFAHFRDRHLAGGPSPRGREFQDFRAEVGEVLEGFAMFEALSEHLRQSNPGGWQAWPEALQDPRSADVRRFAADRGDRVLFSIYLQWLAFGQLRAAARRAREGGMAIGLVADIAIGCDAAGFDCWWDPELNAMDAEIGAPPDPFCAEGQTWGTPPWRPHVLAARGGAPLAELLERTMTWAGGLRLDHIMGITRLFWVPRGLEGMDGTYVAYPQEKLLAVIAEASNRHRCLVVGEDLGTVPEGFRERIGEADILSTRVLQFEREKDGRFRPPVAYPRLSCACAGTHDLATLVGFLEGRDIDARAAIGGEGPDPAGAREERARSIAALRAALAEEGLLAAGEPADPAAVIAAVHGFLGRTGSALALAQLEDILAVADQANLPGTVSGHPNWRRKYPVRVEDLGADGRLLATAETFCRAGR